jgi:ABC-type uncharacterized transport system substrate-binding protein
MRRNVLLLALSALLLALSYSVEAQQPIKIPRIGFLTLIPNPDPLELIFLQGLRNFGYDEGRNIIIEYRRAAGKVESLPRMAEELVRLKVDLIVVRSTPVVQAAKNATTTIPIVMMGVGDPVGSGLVASLARPGGNLTGVSLLNPELHGKRLELLKQVLPRVYCFIKGRGEENGDR